MTKFLPATTRGTNHLTFIAIQHIVSVERVGSTGNMYTIISTINGNKYQRTEMPAVVLAEIHRIETEGNSGG